MSICSNKPPCGFTSIVAFSLDMREGLYAESEAGETFRIPAEVFWNLYMRLDDSMPAGKNGFPSMLAELGLSIADDMAETFGCPSMLIAGKDEEPHKKASAEERFLCGIIHGIGERLSDMGWTLLDEDPQMSQELSGEALYG